MPRMSRIARSLSLLLALAAAVLLAPGVVGYSSEYKIQKMEKQMQGANALVLNSKTFNTYTEAPRNYSLFVTLTAMAPQFGCRACK